MYNFNAGSFYEVSANKASPSLKEAPYLNSGNVQNFELPTIEINENKINTANIKTQEGRYPPALAVTSYSNYDNINDKPQILITPPPLSKAGVGDFNKEHYPVNSNVYYSIEINDIDIGTADFNDVLEIFPYNRNSPETFFYGNIVNYIAVGNEAVNYIKIFSKQNDDFRLNIDIYKPEINKHKTKEDIPEGAAFKRGAFEIGSERMRQIYYKARQLKAKKDLEGKYCNNQTQDSDVYLI